MAATTSAYSGSTPCLLEHSRVASRLPVRPHVILSERSDRRICCFVCRMEEPELPRWLEDFWFRSPECPGSSDANDAKLQRIQPSGVEPSRASGLGLFSPNHDWVSRRPRHSRPDNSQSRAKRVRLI